MDSKVLWLNIFEKKEVDGMALGVPLADYKMSGVLKILFVLNTKGMGYSELLQESGFRLKKSFRTYLNFLQDLEMIVKIGETTKASYAITPKGKTILEMLS